MSTIELGEFDTGLYSGCKFHTEGKQALLTVEVNEVGDKLIKFDEVKYHQFTALYHCDKSMIEPYFKVVELPKSKELKQFLKRDLSGYPPKALKHYRIFLDESGCFDIFAESATLI
ncbi:MAG: hypothetical protein HWE16_13960 [Gammaproteobacteria bacterium]|nr:hypothetical protein [Gammaproteobacteria bacterium]